MRPLSATTLLKARLDTGHIPPISLPPRRLSLAMREVVRSAVAELDAKGITEPGVGQWGSPVAWAVGSGFRSSYGSYSAIVGTVFRPGVIGIPQLFESDRLGDLARSWVALSGCVVSLMSTQAEGEVSGAPVAWPALPPPGAAMQEEIAFGERR